VVPRTDPTAGTVNDVPIAGGSVTQLAFGQNPTSLTTGYGFVYWTNRGPVAGQDVIQRSVGGAPSPVMLPVPVAILQTGASSIAFAYDGIFWTTQTGSVMVLPDSMSAFR
jgi:hypothetical protein